MNRTQIVVLLGVIGGGMLLNGGLSTPGYAQETPQLAPLNPAFVEYLKSPRRMIMDEEGHALGYIPSPLLPEIHVPDKRQASPSDPKYDLRDPNGDGNQNDSLLSPIRDQGSCGTCWAFANYGSLESHLKKFGLDSNPDFSEDNLKHRHGFDLGPCSGGYTQMTVVYLARSDGPISESDDPYDPSPTSTFCTTCTPVRYIDNILYLPVRSSVTDNAYIKSALLTYGALSSAFYWESASYNASNYTYYYNGPEGSNHAIVIVGWDDTKLTVAPTPGAFIIRNSWGTGWGEAGYFYIAYADTKLAFGELAAFDEKADASLAFQKIYMYDPLGNTGAVSYGSNIVWGANWFTPTQDGILTAVGLSVGASNMAYEIRIYDTKTDSSTSSSFSDQLGATQTGTVTYAGYHTIKLNQPVALHAGNGFAVAIKFTAPPANTWPLSLEFPVGDASAATAHAGESYMSPDGASWTDLTANPDFANTNVCIKAFVDAARYLLWTK
ncbi:peptidase C1A, papain [Candidatus Vecturithrix granuli]|uniref:Peptidase C1A, papain n=1 Tax=Vecturithrix granuli TaxID=1499967 RepID=A0A081BZL5_VECG1|nr:peptidase C1A, papain [Candidatus Vecturithrix granuli]